MVRVGYAIGLICAFGSAFTTNVGFLMRHRGANRVEELDARHPGRCVVQLFRERWWALGFVVAFVAWALQVAGLKLAPLSLVQAILASGFVILGVAAERMFGHSVRRREWLGIGLTVVGLAFLALTTASAGSSGQHADYDVATMAVFQGGLVALGVACLLAQRAGRLQARRGVLLGAAAGLLFTLTHVAIKGLTGSVSLSDPSTLLSPWPPIVVAAAVVAFLASARSLQLGDAVPVIAVTGAASNVSAILAGIVVFGDPLGQTPLAVTLRIGAFVLVVAAAALLPAPTRAAGAEEHEGEREGAEERARVAA